MSAPSPDSAPQAPSTQGSPLFTTILVLAVLAAVLTAILRGSYRDGPLEPDSPTPQGSRAVVSVLEDDEVEVSPQRRTDDAARTLSGGGTVLVTAPNSLNAEQLEILDEAKEDGGGRLVLVQPDFVVLSILLPGARPAGTLETPAELTADGDCGESAFAARRIQVQPVEDVSATSTLYTVPDGADGCFTGDSGSAVVSANGVTVLGSASLLANGTVDDRDNSAVALNSLSTDSGLGWYIPSATDPRSSLAPSLVDYLPPWAGPMALWSVLLAVAGIAAVSRRQGPVVIEPLPVSVRSQELTIGRAGMMHRYGARDEAAASLRSACAVRLAHRLGIRRETRLDALLEALAPHTSRTPEQLRELLGPTPITTDRRLVELAHDLDLLDKEISR